MKKRGVVQQDAGDREGWRRRAGERTGQPPLVEKVRQDSKLMMMMIHEVCSLCFTKSCDIYYL